MTFLTPWLLWALPLAAAPVVVHLLNRRRFRSTPWAAMRFLLAADAVDRGHARLRRWLILASRVLALIALVLAVARPLTGGGWFWTSGSWERVAVVDQSPSMTAVDVEGVGRLGAARESLMAGTRTAGGGAWTLIGSAEGRPRRVAEARELGFAPEFTAVDAAADVPGLLIAAADHLRTSAAGPAEVWVVSDGRIGDWRPEDPRWAEVRRALGEFDAPVRMRWWRGADAAGGDRSVRVTGASRRGDVLRVTVEVSGGEDGEVPVTFEVDGAKTVATVTVRGGSGMVEQEVAVDESLPLVSGRVALPADATPGDNVDYFAAALSATRRCVVVGDDADVRRYVTTAIEAGGDGAGGDGAVEYEAVAVEPSATGSILWQDTHLVVWQAALPSGADAEALTAWVADGGRLMLMPPDGDGGGALFGTRWGDWVDGDEDGTRVTSWRGDVDLWRNTDNGDALPIGEMVVRRRRGIVGAGAVLARIDAATPLLMRADVDSGDRGRVYALGTTPRENDSSLGRDGVAFYAMLHRALADAAADRGRVRNVDVGVGSAVAGVDVRRDGVAMVTHRPAEEDTPLHLSEDDVRGLVGDLPLTVVGGDGAGGGWVGEAWRGMLWVMLGALCVEAWLSLPARSRRASASVTRWTGETGQSRSRTAA